MKTLALKIEYDGTNYAGWQVQKNALTVQEVLESCIEAVFGIKLPTIAAGRTDSGVHALGQVVSINLESEISIPQEKILVAINSKLPLDIRIIESKIFDEKFHARFDAQFRQYKYILTTEYNLFRRNHISYIKYPINPDRLYSIANIFKRKTDFTSFSKYNPDNNNPVCDVTVCNWTESATNVYELNIRANHFLYGMVRSIVGNMIDFARNKKTELDIEKGFEIFDRNQNSPLAPPQGLYLEKVFYNNNFYI
ncbi:MAG: tRNA pseudouridine(38-40) synthase TruA [Candidatus Kapabacteria bacterium]|nr:tRNA pseudouridine(38-40) synthase TruA [Ignavibacteriota bacterium]MCW5885540.1 tRNA pseudouridine(38-40) synthase TruA [Candidatus Kapabacteria bacterium]